MSDSIALYSKLSHIDSSLLFMVNLTIPWEILWCNAGTIWLWWSHFKNHNCFHRL